jgi:GlcNAc-PI de-N-acetylase
MKKYQKMSVYLSAHQDDWQLFMTPEISIDIADKNCRTIIIQTTAGDAGKDEGYWKAREKAAVESLVFRLSTDIGIKKNQIEKTFLSHTITGIDINNCAIYFLRLPDGGFDGSGFDKYEYQSMEKLRRGLIPHINSVDKKNQITSWKDATQLIDLIIISEINSSGLEQRERYIELHFPEINLQLNPDDHNDHKNTAELIISSHSYNQFRKRSYVHYEILNIKSKISQEELFWKTGMFCAYHQSLFNDYGHSTISEDQSFIPWCQYGSSNREI